MCLSYNALKFYSEIIASILRGTSKVYIIFDLAYNNCSKLNKLIASLVYLVTSGLESKFINFMSFSGFLNHAKKMLRTNKVVVTMDWKNAFDTVFSAFGTPLIDLIKVLHSQLRARLTDEIT